MAKSALTQLQDQIEAIRNEAFAAGYAAAMQVIQKAASQAAPGAPSAAAGQRRAAPAEAAAAPRPRRQGATRAPTGAAAKAGRAAAARPRRGTNARLVSEVLQAIAPRAARPAEIRTALQRDKGVAMAFTSIRHALGQLEARHAVEQIADSKTWRHVE